MRAHCCTHPHKIDIVEHTHTHTTYTHTHFLLFPSPPSLPLLSHELTRTCEQLERVVCDEIDAEAETDQFKQRVEADKESWARNDFIASIKKEAATRVRVYEEKPPVYFTDSAGLGKAINDALALPLLAR
jgi:hypothetical protein